MVKKGEIRRKKILKLLDSKGTMSITDLSSQFDVSRETIRRDLQELKSSGEIKKWYGTVMPRQDFRIPPVEKRMSERFELKSKIVQQALGLIEHSTVVFIDAGSTALILAKEISKLNHYTIITNSFPVINELVTSDNQVISIGGKVDPLTFSAVGTEALDFLDKIKIDVSFLGTSGFADHHGPTGNSFDDGDIKRKVIQNSRLNVVITDSSKSTYSSLTQYADWHSIDYLITDNGIDSNLVNSLNKVTEVLTV